MISIIKDRSCDVPDVVAERYIAEKYQFAVGGMSISNVKEFLDYVREKFPTVLESNFEFGVNRGNTYFEEKEFMIFLSYYNEGGTCEIYGRDISFASNIYTDLKNFLKEDDEIEIHMHNYVVDGRLDFKEITLDKDRLGSYSEKYYSDFSDINEFFRQFTQTDENILVLSGEAGTGKTKLMNIYMKYLINNFNLLKKDIYDDILIAYVKNEEILANDSFWSNLREFEYDLVILDDLDAFLSQRGHAMTERDVLRDKFTSNLLSFTDGFLPSKTKFIITTNRDIDSIDTAIQRDGRLFGAFSFSRLSRETALEIWEDAGLKKKDFLKEFEEDEILQARLGKIIKQYKVNDNQRFKSFLKNKKADIRNKDFKKKIKL